MVIWKDTGHQPRFAFPCVLAIDTPANKPCNRRIQMVKSTRQGQTADPPRRRHSELPVPANTNPGLETSRCPNLHTTLWTYPWDLADGDPRAIAKRLRDDIGLDGISLAAAYHTFEMLRPHSPKRVLLQIPQAAVYFQPDAGLYAHTPIQPHVSPLMGGDNWYADAADAAVGAGIELIAWTVFPPQFLPGRPPSGMR